MCWNAQGLLASDPARQSQKMRRAASLALHREILVLTETHGNKGKCRGRRLPKGYRAFWSNGEEGEAGVGVWVKEEFMARIEGNDGGHEWMPVVPGRAAILRCWGNEGRIQIGMVYLQTGNSGGRAERIDTMQQLTSELEKGGKTLTILAGDFNFVMNKIDRVSGDPPEHTGGGDAAEAEVVNAMLTRIGLEDMEQNEFTYRFEECRSRIDRMYSNMERYEWMDRDIGCVALDGTTPPPDTD